MRLGILLIVSSSVVLSAMGADPPGGYYTTRYDHLDIENILNQKRLVQYYAACLLEQGPCTPQGTEFKNILPEAIKTNCLRCTEKQRIVTTRTIKRLRKEYPDIWNQLEQRWDPTGVNVKRLLASVNRPVPLSEVPILAERFGDEDQNNISEITTRSPTASSTSGGSISSTTPSDDTASSTNRQSSTSATITTTTPSTTTSRVMYKPVTARPFNSIGPNLMILNPKVIIDKVLHTADAVLNTVSGVLTGR